MRCTVLVAVVLGLFASGCCRRDAVTADVRPESMSWQPYVHDDLGFSLTIPDGFTPRMREQGSYTRFDFRDDVPVRVMWLSPEEGQGRGLWHGETPDAAIMIDGREGYRYAYEHTDGPFCSRRVAYVVPHRGRELAIEFPCADELDAVQQRILWSLRFIPDVANALPSGRADGTSGLTSHHTAI